MNPEFLREKYADDDFINSEIIIFLVARTAIVKRYQIFTKNYTKCICKEHIFTDAISASLIKYTINSFLALKVIFFNEIKSVFDNLNSHDDWLSFTKAISKDKRIGNSHMDVPGPDGRYGFGGPCFPKDVSALIEYSNELGSELSFSKKLILLIIILEQSIIIFLKEKKNKILDIELIKRSNLKYARVVELVDTRDLKSLDRNIVPVQVRPRVQNL